MARLYVPLDVNFPDDDKIEAAGLAGAGLYAMSLCVAKRTLTDGRLTRVKLRKLGADDALIDRCIDVGLYTRDADDAVRITAWLGWNKPAESVLSSEKGKHLAHLRHHAQKGVVNPSCRYCMDPTLEDPQVNADECAEDADRTEPQCGKALPEVETESEIPTQVSGLPTTAAPDPPSRDDDHAPPATDEQTIRRTAALVGRSIADRAGATNPGAYATTVTTGILTGDDRTDRNRILSLLQAGQDPEQIASSWQPHPLDGLFPGDTPRATIQPPRPALQPFDMDAHLAEADAQRALVEAQEPQEVTW